MGSGGADDPIYLLEGESWSTGSGDARITVTCGGDTGSDGIRIEPGRVRVVRVADDRTVTVHCVSGPGPDGPWAAEVAEAVDPPDPT
jgi:hypothetical protein